MTSRARQKIPNHLKKYVVDQNYDRYTPEDQAVWRYIMRQLKDFLSLHAHSCYVDGLKKTGISIEQIPLIEEMDDKLSEFGWGAIPVSGFIPPAAFMEFQSLGLLPIASDMRTMDHLLYTPAPDIVHEAAGHAPILIDPKFAEYLRKYAEVATNAIISKEDMDQYEAIRILSDIKEDSNSTDDDIARAEENLIKINHSMRGLSEAALLSRMNWWTAEYGLIGSLEKPHIFGAGLLSSAGEARTCLKAGVQKIPLTVDCVDYSYDITEPQPQLFVTPDFETLQQVLEQLADRMAYRRGGTYGLDRAIESATVNTVQLNSGVQISGNLASYLATETAGQKSIIYLKFTGPSQLAFDRAQIAGHGPEYHSQGFSTPVGFIKNQKTCLSKFNESQLKELGLEIGTTCELNFESGVGVKGQIKNFFFQQSRLLLISWVNCTVTYQGQILFDPSWGTFDMAVGSSIPSVFGGPADRLAYGDTDDFVAKKVPAKAFAPTKQKEFQFYNELRQTRSTLKSFQKNNWDHLINTYLNHYPENWLMGVELLEIAQMANLDEDLIIAITKHLNLLAEKNPQISTCIQDGIKLSDVLL